jgi:hypothetical protein
VRKAIYELRQAPLAWIVKLEAMLGELGFAECATESRLEGG